MKKLILVFAVLIAMFWALPALASTFSDVPTDHWAYEAIDYLQSQGLVEGYPDGTFKGQRPFTRYEMAMVVARIYNKLEEMVKKAPQGGVDQAKFDELVAQVQKLGDEFKSELSDLGVKVDALSTKVDEQGKEIDKLKSLIKETNMAGTFRVRSGVWSQTGVKKISNDTGHEMLIDLDYGFKPADNIGIRFDVTAAEAFGGAGSNLVPGVNNVGNVHPSTPPYGYSEPGTTFVLDQAYAKIDLKPYTTILGYTPTLTVGKQYFSHGEFGLAGDNGYRSDFGYRFDTTFSRSWNFYAAVYKVEGGVGVVGNGAAYLPTRSNMSSSVLFESDDYTNAGLGYWHREGKVPGHVHDWEIHVDGSPNGYGYEQFIDVSGNAEMRFFDPDWLNGIRAEWIYVPQNVSDYDAKDWGLQDNSAIVELDLYNNGNTKVTLAGASIAQLEGLPAYANVDNDPFSEWDYTANVLNDAFNLSREGKNYFPADFVGLGATAEHTFGNKLWGKVTWYDGRRIDANFDDRPGLLKFNFRYPFAKNASIGLDVITTGTQRALTDSATLWRGELLIHF